MLEVDGGNVRYGPKKVQYGMVGTDRKGSYARKIRVQKEEDDSCMREEEWKTDVREALL